MVEGFSYGYCALESTLLAIQACVSTLSSSEAIILALRRCPLLIYMELTGLALALVVSAWVALVFAEPTRDVVSLDLPKAEEMVWDDRVAKFASRIGLVFGLNDKVAREYAEWSLDAAARHKVPPELLVSLIYVESTFDKTALSERGAMGPAQVMPHVWSRVCRGDLSRPADNIDCGARILAAYLRACGDYTCALARYNGAAGPANGAGRRYVAKIDVQRQRLRKALL